MGLFFLKKKKKPYKFPPNIHFYKNGEVVSKVYAERGEDMEKAIKKAKEEFGADGYMSFAVTGRTAWIDLTKKKRKWGGKP